MIDHVSIAVRDLDRAARFYETVLGAIGYGKLDVRPATVGFGKAYPEFWINLRPSMGEIADDCGSHVGLRVRTPELVDAFHAAALAAGGTCEGPPGPRDFTPTAYAAYVRDLDGNKLTAYTFVPG